MPATSSPAAKLLCGALASFRTSMPLPWNCSCPTVGYRAEVTSAAGNLLDGTETTRHGRGHGWCSHQVLIRALDPQVYGRAAFGVALFLWGGRLQPPACNREVTADGRLQPPACNREVTADHPLTSLCWVSRPGWGSRARVLYLFRGDLSVSVSWHNGKEYPAWLSPQDRPSARTAGRTDGRLRVARGDGSERVLRGGSRHSRLPPSASRYASASSRRCARLRRVL